MQLIDRFILPATLAQQDGIRYWQEKVLLTLLFATAILGTITYIPSMLLAIKEGLWVVAAIDTIMYFLLLFLFFRRNIPYDIRAAVIPVISFVLGLVLITTLGPFGAGPVWLFFFPIITGVLLGYRAASFALILNFGTIIGLGIIIHFKITDLMEPFNFNPWLIASENALEKWVIISLNFMLLNVVATLSVTTILKGLQKSMSDLAASEKKYRHIFENIQDVYFETRLDGTIVEISPSIESISQYTADDLKKRSLIDIYDSLEQREILIEQLSTKGFLKDFEVHLRDKDKKVRPCSVNARVITDDNNIPIGSVGILRDLSFQKAMEKEKKQLEEQLLRAQKMEALGLLAGGVAHDLNNILSGIVTYPELLSMDLDENDPIKKGLDVIHSSGLRAAEIVQDLLTLSRRGVIAREVLDLNNLVLNFLHTPEYKKILSFHPNVNVKTEIHADTPFLKGSSIHLQKTLMNLISNAAEAQIGSGQIIIRTLNRHLSKPVKGYDRVETGNYIVLSVEDQGTGISPEDLSHIFEPFFTKKVMGRSGTGLGMAVVWGTVQDHEGYIDIISTPGKGTVFDLYFPICADEAITPAQKLFPADYMGNNEKILIVDDQPEQRQIAGATLKKLGYQATAVASGEAAVEYLKDHEVDLIILDMIMDPGMNGLETFREIIKFKPGQKAIIASGYSKTQQVNDVMQLGAGGYIKKPYTIEKIGIAVKTELAGKP
ncbi:MAG: response regulator [Proteobacteria bacterium]|nr:response regulator [Pseudomonadota bacterium]MBU2479755.1 response regulator [Pseudomonadota bacterium]